MATPQQLLAQAAAELGYTESPRGSNRTKFAAQAGHANGQPWCATFLVAIARRVGLRLPSESAYTPTMANGFKAIGGWHTGRPAPGDLAFFDFPGDSKRRIQHVGVVESATPDWVTTIDGNTSSGPGGSEDNGGGVFRRTRTRAHVVGFGRPRWASTNRLEDEQMQRGDSGPDVTTLQREINVIRRYHGVTPIAEDGDFGPATEVAVKDVQGVIGRPQTGVVGLMDALRLARWIAWRDGLRYLEAHEAKPHGGQPAAHDHDQYVRRGTTVTLP